MYGTGSFPGAPPNQSQRGYQIRVDEAEAYIATSSVPQDPFERRSLPPLQYAARYSRGLLRTSTWGATTHARDIARCCALLAAAPVGDLQRACRFTPRE